MNKYVVPLILNACPNSPKEVKIVIDCIKTHQAKFTNDDIQKIKKRFNQTLF
jgi:DNA-directed RNA polymerase subunit F